MASSPTDARGVALPGSEPSPTIAYEMLLVLRVRTERLLARLLASKGTPERLRITAEIYRLSKMYVGTPNEPDMWKMLELLHSERREGYQREEVERMREALARVNAAHAAEIGEAVAAVSRSRFLPAAVRPREHRPGCSTRRRRGGRRSAGTGSRAGPDDDPPDDAEPPSRRHRDSLDTLPGVAGETTEPRRRLAGWRWSRDR